MASTKVFYRQLLPLAMQLLDEGSILAISTAILVAGIVVFLLLFVPYIRERITYMRPLLALVIIFFTVLAIIVLASWMVYYARQWPWLLYPVVIITLFFRAAAPYFMWGELHRKHGHRKIWSSGMSFFKVASFVLVAQSLYSVYTEQGRDAMSFWEDVVMFLTVLYNYSSMYLRLFMPFIKNSKVVLNWVSMLLISLSFIIMLPLIVPEFHAWYRVANAVGWLVGLWYLHRLGARVPDSDAGKEGDGNNAKNEEIAAL